MKIATTAAVEFCPGKKPSIPPRSPRPREAGLSTICSTRRSSLPSLVPPSADDADRSSPNAPGCSLEKSWALRWRARAPRCPTASRLPAVPPSAAQERRGSARKACAQSSAPRCAAEPCPPRSAARAPSGRPAAPLSWLSSVPVGR